MSALLFFSESKNAAVLRKGGFVLAGKVIFMIERRKEGMPGRRHGVNMAL